MIIICGQNIPKEIVLFFFAAIGWLIGFFFRRWHIRYQACISAAIEFRNTFVDELVMLSSTIIKRGGINDNLADTIVNKALPDHKAAFLKYKTYLSRYKRFRLQRAWNKYSCKEDQDFWIKDLKDYSSEHEIICYSAHLIKKGKEYIKQEFTNEYEFKMRALARKRIEKLIKII